MKKTGIVLGALIGTIIGIAFLLILVPITFKILKIGYSGEASNCHNYYYWKDIKENLEILDNEDKSFTSFFPSSKKYCHLVSFDINQGSIQTPPEVSQKNKAAICLCKEVSDVCEELQECYFFKNINLINSIKWTGSPNPVYEQLNTANPPQEEKNYLFLRFKKEDNILYIDTNIY